MYHSFSNPNKFTEHFLTAVGTRLFGLVRVYCILFFLSFHLGCNLPKFAMCTQGMKFFFVVFFMQIWRQRHLGKLLFNSKCLCWMLSDRHRVTISNDCGPIPEPGAIRPLALLEEGFGTVKQLKKKFCSELLLKYYVWLLGLVSSVCMWRGSSFRWKWSQTNVDGMCGASLPLHLVQHRE